MKIEELKHIDIKRKVLTEQELGNWWLSNIDRELFNKNGYVPQIDCMADSYGIIARVLDKDCVVAYITDNSTTAFLIKTSRQYVGFVCLSEKLSKFLSSNSTRRITRLSEYYGKKDNFMKFADDENMVITDKDLWEKYFKTKLLEKLENE